MTSMRWMRGTLVLAAAALAAHMATAQVLFLQPKPGDIYREYARVVTGDSLLVTDPDTPIPAARAYLPNARIPFRIDDLQDARDSVDIVITLWGGHEGTTGKKIRINDGPWVPIPELDVATNGIDPNYFGYFPEHNCDVTGGESWFHQLNPVLRVPTSYFVQGTNYIEGTNTGQSCPSWNWGLFAINGFIVRVYYNSSKPHPTGQITSIADGGTLVEGSGGQYPSIEISASGPSAIDKVDFLAYYEGYDTDGDGVFLEYHHDYPESVTEVFIDNHVGTAYSTPWRVTWNTEWVPDQPAGRMKLLARIQDANGIWYVTPEVNDVSLRRIGRSVKLYQPYSVPPAFQVSDGKVKYSHVYIPPEDNLADATAAFAHIRTWNGANGDGTAYPYHTMFNGWTAPNYGKVYAASYDILSVPPSAAVNGENTFEFYAAVVGHHGIDIDWPGPGLVVGYVGDYASPQVPVTVLESPADNATDVSASPTLSWYVTPSASAYRVQVARDAGFNTIVVDDSSLTDTYKDVTGLLSNATYYWRVQARSPVGFGPWSAAWQFSTGTSTTQPVLIYPPNSSTGISTSMTLRWSSATGGTPYRLQLGTDPTFVTGVIMDDPSITDTFKVVNGLAYDTEYHWRVGFNVGGGAMDYTATWSFTTEVKLPSAPLLISPPDGSIEQPVVGLVLQWASEEGVTSYWCQIGTDPTFATGLFRNDSSITDTFRMVSGLAATTQYYWRISGKSSAGRGPFSPLWTFQTRTVASVVNGQEIPESYVLGQNYPNPFNPETRIQFGIPQAGRVRLEVYSLLGERAATLVDGTLPAGYHAVAFNARELTSGVYLYRLTAGESTLVRKMVLMK